VNKKKQKNFPLQPPAVILSEAKDPRYLRFLPPVASFQNSAPAQSDAAEAYDFTANTFHVALTKQARWPPMAWDDDCAEFKTYAPSLAR